MTNRKKFIYNGILLTLVGLLIKTVNLAYSAFVSREIGAEALGLFTLIGTVYSFAVTFATSGINLTVTRLVASALGEGRENEIGRIMRNSVLYALLFSCTSTLVLFFGSGYFAERVLEDARAEGSLKILAFSLIPIALFAVFSGYFIGVRRIKRSSATQVISQGLRITLGVLFVMRAEGSGAAAAVFALSLSTVLSELFSFLLSLFLYILEGKKEKSGAPVSRFGDVTAMALPLALSTYIRSALLTLEHILIPSRLRHSGVDESEALSSYGILHGMALPLLLYPMSPLSSFAGLLVPEFAEAEARGDKGRMARITEDVFRATLAYAAPCAVFIFLFSEELGYIVYSSYSAGYYISLLAPVLPIMYLDHVTDAILKGVGEQVYSMWVNITDSLLSVFLVWLLIPKMGIAGYALVIVLMEGYNFVLSFIKLRGRVKFRLTAFLSFLPSLLAATVASLASLALFRFSGSLVSPFWLASKILFAISLYVAISYALSLLSKKCVK